MNHPKFVISNQKNTIIASFCKEESISKKGKTDHHSLLARDLCGKCLQYHQGRSLDGFSDETYVPLPIS